MPPAPRLTREDLRGSCTPPNTASQKRPARSRTCNARCKTASSWVLICAYQQEAQSALARYAQEPMFDDEIRAEVIKDIRRMYVGLREQLALYDFTVFHGLPTPLLINEAPFIDWRVRAQPPQLFVSLPLGPYCLLVGTPSGKKARAGPVLWKPVATMGPFKDHNRHMVEAARLWLVAITEDQLISVQSRFAPVTPDKR